MADAPAPPSEVDETDVPIATTASEYPPYPPYSTATAPPSVAETIVAGRDLRRKFKFLPQRPARPPPRPARPRGPKATDVKLSKRQYRAHARCLRRHGAVLTDRLEHMAKPSRRHMIYLWREHADILTPDAIGRIRAMLDADEPFKPEQAYEYFVNLRKTKRKRNKKLRRQGKTDLLAICDDKRFLWARNASVAFARGIQQRLARPGRYALADGMLCLSNLILNDICGYMRMKTPSRNSTSPKARFMMEMSDKIAVWIDEILTESDDRMLMMDFDEDEDVIAADAAGDTRFTDDFLEMMQHGQDQPLKQTPAYKQFTGDMLEVFIILTNAMYKHGDESLIDHGKFHQTYTEAANLLKETPTFDVLEINSGVAKKINNALSGIAKPLAPKNLEVPMGAMIDLCSNFLAENAENNKDKGPGFKLLISTLRKQPKQVLFEKDRIKETYEDAATELTQARSLESDHDDPVLTGKIQEGLKKVVAKVTPHDMQTDMNETIDLCSKYLSQGAIDKLERGPAFDIIIKELVFTGAKPFTPQFSELETNFATAHVLTKAPGLSSISPNPATMPLFEKALHKVVDLVTPKALKQEMNEVIKRCASYLSGYVRDREQALKLLVETMKKTPTKDLAKRGDYAMAYGTAAEETEKAPNLVPYLPVKDIATEIKEKLASDVKPVTPAQLHVPMKVLVQDVADVLSQPIAMKSGVAGEKYPMDYLIAVEKSMGTKPLYEYKGYSETYAGAAKSLQATPVPDDTIENKQLEKEIFNELQSSLPPKSTPLINKELDAPVTEAASKLAKIGTVKGIAFEHLTTAMKEKGDEQLVKKMEYEESYVAGGHRLIDAPNLATKKVDEVAYEKVKEKLAKLVEDKPPPEKAKQQMEAIIDESSKYLTAPLEDEHDKRRFLADLMSRKQDEVLAQEKAYKITFKEGGQELLEAPAIPAKPVDPQLKNDLKKKIGGVVTQKGLQNILKDTISDAASNLTNIVKGRGEIIRIIHDDMKTAGKKPFLSVGKFNKTHEEAAEMIDKAPNFGTSNFALKIHKIVTDRINELPMKGVSEEAKPYVPDAVDIVSKYIAGVATKECGLDPKSLEDWGGSEADKHRRSSSLQSKLSSQPRLSLQPGLPSPLNIESQGQLQAQQQQQQQQQQQKQQQQQQQPQSQGSSESQQPLQIRSFQKNEELKKTQKETKATDVDMDHEQAEQLLQQKLKGRGGEVFYKQPHNELSHTMAADWISEPSLTTDKSVKESSDTGRLQKKFERKLSALVATDTPPQLKDSMQDVIIESSRNLSEKFMSKSYKVLAREAVISEMQNRGNEILAEVNEDTESYFYSAQRLKKNKNIEAYAPREVIQEQLSQKLGEMIKGRGMPRKVAPYIKEYVQTTAGYLSEHVTIPDKEIEAYIALLTEAEVAGDTPLVEGKIHKTHAEAVAYWRKLTTFDDEINRPDATLQSSIENKLKKVMEDVTPSGYEKTDLNNVIKCNAGLLTSYVKLQEEKSEALKILVEQMDKEKDAVLLRHGTLRKTHLDGANLLRTKTADQLSVTNVDPVVSRKIQIKLKILANKSFATNKYKDLIDDVVDDVTNYLAVYFLQPEVIQVCKCMKNVIVQCELWCEGSLRRIGRVCSRRSRHVSIQDMSDVCPGRAMQLGPCGPRICGSGVEISIRQCPLKHTKSSQTCPASKPSPGCGSNITAGYALYPSPGGPFDNIPTKLSASECSEETTMLTPESDAFSTSPYNSSSKDVPYSESQQPIQPPLTFEKKTLPNFRSLHMFGSTPTVIVSRETNSSVTGRPKVQPQSSWTTQTRNIYSSRTPIVTTDQMTDWHSMMVSIMWNIQAWKTWIHNSIKKVLTFQENSDLELDKTWINFQRTTTTEILQWTQYKSFSRQLIIRIASKYKNKKIVSPTRTTVKTRNFIDTHNEMLDLIEMFNRWTHWLTDAIKETDLLLQYKDSSSERWRILKERVKENLKEWTQCNERLCSPWESRFKRQLSEWVPGWRQPGPVWVISACGAVPSAAVSAGVCDGEDTWVARTTHNCKILPAALYPSMHCCVLYHGGRIYHYTKYQVFCNASVLWLAWRAGSVPERAVRVGAVYVGRVRYRASYLLGAVTPPRYRCHVVMFGRPVAFDCFELLLLNVAT